MYVTVKFFRGDLDAKYLFLNKAKKKRFIDLLVKNYKVIATM